MCISKITLFATAFIHTDIELYITILSHLISIKNFKLIGFLILSKAS